MAMSDLNNDLFEEMLNDYLPEEKKSGDVITGIITRKDMDFAYLDLSGKQEGRILIREVEDFNVGDTIEVKVLRNDEEYVIVSKFLLDKAREFLSYEVDEIVTGTILKKIKGGYSVRVGKNEAFLPFSLASLERDKDYTEEKFKFLIKEKGRNNLTLSRTDLVKKEELDYRLENIGAGYVYIISNIGAFGENVFKIGVTRRLEPTERISELSSASVPFKFDVHALIFSYQAFELEKELHNYFNDKRVNMVNNRKEFFNITIEEIERALEKHKDLTFEFNKIPDAEEYRETLKLRN